MMCHCLMFSFIQNALQKKLLIYIVLEYELQNADKPCLEKCKGPGPCTWCGRSGMCCARKIERTDRKHTGVNECDGTFGGWDQHQCALKPSKSFSYILLFRLSFSSNAAILYRNLVICIE